MGFEETGERLWRQMSIPERESLLKALAEAICGQPVLWGGMSNEVVAQISRFDDLPSELRGRLIMAMTEEGFSVEEHARVQRIVSELYRHP